MTEDAVNNLVVVHRGNPVRLARGARVDEGVTPGGRANNSSAFGVVGSVLRRQ